MKKIVIVFLAVLSVLAFSPGVAQAGPKARCWYGFDIPVKVGKYVHGHASLVCENGYRGSSPILRERIVNMDIEATLRSRMKGGKWVNRGQFEMESKKGAGVLNIDLGQRCFGNKSTLWQVHISFAAADARSGKSWDWYGKSSRTAELSCG